MSSIDVATPQTTDEFYEYVGRVKNSDYFTAPEYFALRIEDFFVFSVQASKPGIYAVLHEVLDLGSNRDGNSREISAVEISYFDIREALRLLDPFMYEKGVHENIDALLRAMYATSASSSQVSLVLIPHGVDADGIEDLALRNELQAFVDASSA